jgi:hypothetical protein
MIQFEIKMMQEIQCPPRKTILVRYILLYSHLDPAAAQVFIVDPKIFGSELDVLVEQCHQCNFMICTEVCLDIMHTGVRPH